MDEGPQIWHLDRNDVTFETLIKSGHFANIYKAKLRTGSKPEAVVAKTLKGDVTTCFFRYSFTFAKMAFKHIMLLFQLLMGRVQYKSAITTVKHFSQ